MSPPFDVTNELAPAPTCAFGKIVPSGLEMGPEHSNF